MDADAEAAVVQFVVALLLAVGLDLADDYSFGQHIRQLVGNLVDLPTVPTCRAHKTLKHIYFRM